MTALGYFFFVLFGSVLVGIGVGLTFGGWLGMSAGIAIFLLTPIHSGVR